MHRTSKQISRVSLSDGYVRCNKRPGSTWGRDWGGSGRWQLSVKSDIWWKSVLNHLFQIRTVKVILQWFSGENKSGHSGPWLALTVSIVPGRPGGRSLRTVLMRLLRSRLLVKLSQGGYCGLDWWWTWQAKYKWCSYCPRQLVEEGRDLAKKDKIEDTNDEAIKDSITAAENKK